MQKNAKKCKFLPPFLAQKQISPIKSPFLLLPTTPIFKISLKNPCFLDFLSFFLPFFIFILSILASAAVSKSSIETCLTDGQEADVYGDSCVTFGDFAILADSWLEEVLWPQ